MIRKLRLVRFGKFRDRVFGIAPVTIFRGENESGKTTIFDALFQCLSEPKGNTTEGRRLADRYGDDRAAELDFDGEAMKIPPDEFCNIYAIGAGDISLDFSAGGDWLRKIKASIFTGGVDPGLISADFEKQAGEKRSLSHMKELIAKKDELDKARKDLEALLEKKARILEGEKNYANKRRELDSVAAAVTKIESELAEKEQLLAQQKLHVEREGILQVVERLGKFEALKGRIDALSAFAEDKTASLTTLQGEAEEARAGAALSRKDAENLISQTGDISKRLEEKRRYAEDMRGKSAVAGELVRAIENDAPRTVVREDTSWNRALLLMGLLPLAAGAAAFFILYPGPVAAAALLGGAVGAFVLAFFARKRTTLEERPDTAQFVERIKDQWRVRTGGAGLTSSTPEGLSRELTRAQSESDSASREVSSLAADAGAMRERLDEAEKSAKRAADLKAAAESAFQAALHRAGVKSRDEYVQKRSEYVMAERQLDEVRRQLNADMEKYGARDIGALRAECELREARLRKEISTEKITEAAVNALEKEAASLKKELRNLEDRRASLQSAIAKAEGEVKGSLGDLPERIYEREQAIGRLDREIEALDLNRKAAAVARDIFKEIAGDSDMVFEELGADISRYTGGIIPGGREIAMSGFSKDAIRMADARGEPRPLEELSTGTRDVFCLAARLALAVRSRGEEGPGIIVLDEPFHSLDAGRVEGALALLEGFHREQGWQILIFTKDDAVADTASRRIPEALVHELTV